MRQRFWFVLLITVILAACGAPPATPTEQVEGYVATVNGVEISAQAYQDAARFIRYQLIARYEQIAQLSATINDANLQASLSSQMQELTDQLDDSRALGEQVLDYVLNDELLRQEARRRGVMVTADEVEARLQAMFLYFPAGAPTPPTGPTATPYTANMYAQDLHEYFSELQAEAGLSESNFRRFIESQLYLEKMTAAIGADVAATEEQVHARHILVADEATARDILAQLQSGASWDELAAAYSQDTSNAQEGGDLGWFGRGVMAPGFEQAAFDTPSGEIGGPIQTEYGWHLIEVIERREGPRDADVVEQERRDRLQAWLDSQLDSLDASGKPIVEINPDWANYIPETPVIAPK